jgi:hypothetical protein
VSSGKFFSSAIAFMAPASCLKSKSIGVSFHSR